MADYQQHLAEFQQNEIAVYALSTDPEDKARETAEKNGVKFPILYGVPGQETAAAWGSYYEERRSILHATAFVLRPDHTIGSATYSTGPVGRLVAEDALRFIAFHKEQAAKK